ncbi:MAG: FAD:protein FMN transferase [Lachnospiraceae bacterium]|nr:FAD:protein FMN transferase [Lachnospiraceae bacterium]
MKISRNLTCASLFITLLILALICLTGCTRTAEPVTETGFYLDTVIQITLYETGNREECSQRIKECFALIDEYEHLFSATLEDSDIWNINHGNGEPVVVSQKTGALIVTALDYAVMTEGIVDPTIRPVSELWNFRSGEEHHVPDETAIADALSHVSYKNVRFGNSLYSEADDAVYNTIILSDPESAIDLGFIAKGYIADKLKEYLLSQGVESACISLGGNVITIGEKPDGSPFRIGIQEPFAADGTSLGTIDIRDLSVVTSGIYERCFYEDDVLYHHVLDTATGYPVENELASVTIICESSTKADVLSTSCLCMGLENGRHYLDREQVDYLLITRDGTQYASENFPVIH